jgi:hypothetical protein
MELQLERKYLRPLRLETRQQAFFGIHYPAGLLRMALSQSHCMEESSDEVRSKAGWVCLLPEEVQVGIGIGIFCGCPIPFVLRLPDSEMYQLVGCCYVDNAMNGQIVEGMVDGEEWLEQDIILL